MDDQELVELIKQWLREREESAKSEAAIIGKILRLVENEKA